MMHSADKNHDLFALATAAMSFTLMHIETKAARMTIGPSVRIVVEIAPQLKCGLCAELARDRLTFKEWSVVQAERYFAARRALKPSIGSNRLVTRAS